MIKLPLQVMEPKSRAALPGPGYLYQVKWDGMRLLAINQGSHLFFQSKQGRIFSDLFPELRGDLEWLPPDSVVDGEVVVLREGKPHFPSLLSRIQKRTPGKAFNSGAQDLEVEYVIFDVLHWAGVDWRSRRLIERLELLAATVPGLGRCQCIESFADGEALWSGVRALGLEGVVAKLPSSRYVGGKQDTWLKIKNWQEMDFFVGGLKLKNKVMAAVYLGSHEDSGLVYVGSVSRGLRHLNALLDELVVVEQSPFAHGPKPGSGEQVIWVKPGPRVRVRFLEWTDEGKLRHGSICGYDQQR